MNHQNQTVQTGLMPFSSENTASSPPLPDEENATGVSSEFLARQQELAADRHRLVAPHLD